MTKGTQKAIELLNDPINQKFYEDRILSNSEVVMIYKIYLMLLNREEIFKIKDENVFFTKLCDFFITNSNGKLGILMLYFNIYFLFKLVEKKIQLNIYNK